MRLRAKYKRSHYKSDSSYLTAVYRNNKAIIDEQLAGVGAEGGVSTLQQFKYLVAEKQQKIWKMTKRRVSVTTAMNKFTESRDFTPSDLHFKENFVKGLKKFGAFQKLYKLTGKKFDMNKLSYIGDNMYSYRGYVIKLNNSPKKIEIYKGVQGNKVETLQNKYAMAL